MPSRPKVPCNKPGCRELVEGGYCTAHKRQTYKEDRMQRGSSNDRGYTSKWRTARKGYLAKHPLCVHCLNFGIITGANEVDHIIPHRGDWTVFWDSTNWQPLCKRCHSRKTATEVLH